MKPLFDRCADPHVRVLAGLLVTVLCLLSVAPLPFVTMPSLLLYGSKQTVVSR
jgi:hypothetical protein